MGKIYTHNNKIITLNDKWVEEYEEPAPVEEVYSLEITGNMLMIKDIEPSVVTYTDSIVYDQYSGRYYINNNDTGTFTLNSGIGNVTFLLMSAYPSVVNCSYNLYKGNNLINTGTATGNNSNWTEVVITV